MTQRPVTRRPVPPRPTARRAVATPMRRTPRVRRASAGLSPIRAGAALVMLLAAAAIYGVGNSSAFTFNALRVEGGALTDPAAVAAALEDARGANLFQLVTGPLEDEVATLTTVADATVRVHLPDTLVVALEEREAILVWRVGARHYLADLEGNLFALLGDVPPAEAAALPVIEDRRATSAGLSVGRTIDPVDFDAARRLASLTPPDVGSSAERLAVLVTDQRGFVLRSAPDGWDAVFGFYTPSLRTPELVPGQVRLLRSLIIGREPSIDRVILASDTDGTYTTKPPPTPAPDPSASPTP